MSSFKVYRCGDFSIYRDYEENQKASTGNAVNDFLIRNKIRVTRTHKKNLYLMSEKLNRMKIESNWSDMLSENNMRNSANNNKTGQQR